MDPLKVIYCKTYCSDVRGWCKIFSMGLYITEGIGVCWYVESLNLTKLRLFPEAIGIGVVDKPMGIIHAESLHVRRQIYYGDLFSKFIHMQCDAVCK
jgi:hypothetical protein